MSSTKHYQRYNSSIGLKGEIGDLTAEWVDEVLSHHGGGWIIEPSMCMEFTASGLSIVTVDCSYAKKGADRSCITGLAEAAFGVPWGIEWWVPKEPYSIVRLARTA